jgi:hypothetical protein
MSCLSSTRTSEYQSYVQRAGSVVQGDLTDPKYYFDYISCVQYLVINRAMNDPETDFEELQPKEGDPTSGAYNSELQTVRVHRTVPNELLVATHDERVGTSIFDYIQDTYRGTEIELPDFAAAGESAGRGPPNIDEVHQSLAQLVKLFRINGFALGGSVQQIAAKNKKAPSASTVGTKSSSTTTFLLTLQAPATLWSASWLDKQKAPVRNDFLLKTAKQLVQSMGYSVVSSSVKIKGDEELSYLTIA